MFLILRKNKLKIIHYLNLIFCQLKDKLKQKNKQKKIFKIFLKIKKKQ